MKRVPMTVALVGLLAANGLAQESELWIVVNASNRVSALSREQLSSLFLKKARQWEDGTDVVPVDQSLQSQVRSRFTSQVLGRRVSWVKNYWTEQIFTGRGTPPTVRTSDEEVIAFVAEHDGAIGYIAGKTEPTEGVRRVRVEP